MIGLLFSLFTQTVTVLNSFDLFFFMASLALASFRDSNAIQLILVNEAWFYLNFIDRNVHTLGEYICLSCTN